MPICAAASLRLSFSDFAKMPRAPAVAKTTPVCRPATQFCCGCSVEFGVKAILLYNFLQNIFVISMVTLRIVFKSEMGSLTPDLTLQIVVAGYTLSGLPIIIVAFWGTLNKAEGPLRLYWLYMVLTFAFDSVFIFKNFVLEGPCEHLPPVFSGSGRAFACGMARGTNVTSVVAMVVIQLYCIFVVHSYCDDLAQSAGGLDLGDLQKRQRPLPTQNNYDVDSVYVHCLGTPDAYGTVSSIAAAKTQGGSSKVFGEYHEMSFPPRNAPGMHYSSY